MKIPVLASDLIKQLDETVSTGKLTSLGFLKTERELWFEAGKRDLVDSLKLSLERDEPIEQKLLKGE